MEIPIKKQNVVPQLWAFYQKSESFKKGEVYSIRANHPLIIEREELGAKSIVAEFERELSGNDYVLEKMLERTNREWIEKLENYHRLLFKDILINCGKIRNSTQRVYIGDPNEDIFNIPQTPGEIITQLDYVISLIKNYLTSLDNDMDSDDFEKVSSIAKIHFQFIRIHPFPDGNGRIGRLLIDQLLLISNFTPAMGGYPRTDTQRRSKYHQAIKACVTDELCTDLANWIMSYINKSSELIS